MLDPVWLEFEVLVPVPVAPEVEVLPFEPDAVELLELPEFPVLFVLPEPEFDAEFELEPVVLEPELLLPFEPALLVPEVEAPVELVLDSFVPLVDVEDEFDGAAVALLCDSWFVLFCAVEFEACSWP